MGGGGDNNKNSGHTAVMRFITPRRKDTPDFRPTVLFIDLLVFWLFCYLQNNQKTKRKMIFLLVCWLFCYLQYLQYFSFFFRSSGHFARTLPATETALVWGPCE